MNCTYTSPKRKEDRDSDKAPPTNTVNRGRGLVVEKRQARFYGQGCHCSGLIARVHSGYCMYIETCIRVAASRAAERERENRRQNEARSGKHKKKKKKKTEKKKESHTRDMTAQNGERRKKHEKQSLIADH